MLLLAGDEWELVGARILLSMICEHGLYLWYAKTWAFGFFLKCLADQVYCNSLTATVTFLCNMNVHRELLRMELLSIQFSPKQAVKTLLCSGYTSNM